MDYRQFEPYFLDSVDQGFLRDLFRKEHYRGALLLLSETDRHNIEAIQKIAKDEHCQIFGAVFPELIFEGEFKKKGILILAFDRVPAHLLFSGESIEKDPEVMLSKIEELIPEDSEKKTRSLFTIFDALNPEIGSILNEIYFRLGDSVTYSGSNCGSETFQKIPSLFDTDHSVTGGVLVLLLDQVSSTMMENGFERPDTLVTATSSDGNRISSIEWKPAFEVYSTFVREQYGNEITKDNFYNYGVHFPFGIIRGDEPPIIRIPVEMGEDQSLFCVGEIPPNSVLTLLKAPPLEPMHAVDRLTKRLQTIPGNLLVFYCAGRRLHFGEGASEELLRLKEGAGERILFGALSLGELGNDNGTGYPLFQNATILTVAIQNEK